MEELIAFCPSCFASEEDGSWNHTVEPTAMYCLNCGAGSCIRIEKWAVKEIRRNAAWVGIRYYADDETKDTYAELRALRKAIGSWPGRTCRLETPEQTGKAYWRIRQESLGVRRGMWTEISEEVVPGDTPEQVIERTASSLPWAGG